jgi:hypothetical protein
MADIAASLAEYGADLASLRLFDDDSPDLLPYATLVTERRSNDPTLGVVGAVYEWQGAPLIFLVDADLLVDDDHLHRIRRLLAMRGDAPYLGVVEPGLLDVYRIALDKKKLGQVRVNLDVGEGSKWATLARLGNVRPQAVISQRGWIFNVILNLLTESITKLTKLKGVSNEEAISLVGRALFTRFLADRKLLPGKMSGAGVEARLFDNRQAAEETSSWLDSTFNGDFLPLSDNTFNTLPDQAYRVLGNILRRADNNQLFLGWEEKWNNLDFAHIPVGVLSQAYELYLRDNDPTRQRKEGSYYTPRPIADLMVRASFSALEREGKSSTAKVLDPAAGAGVFLITAFRELVASRWKADGKRPTTNTLRKILYRQIVGFDINESALRFAALGLYLMSIELDPKPKPVDKLRFKNLRGNVLHLVAQEGEDARPGLGSLGPLVGKKHRGKYDLVIGNPPWSSSTKLPDWALVKKTVAAIATDRGIANQSPPLPNAVLDLPFVWRAMEWAKQDGQITFALHARLLFQQGDGMPNARLALFEALDVTSIINGAELRQTKVWPKISAPFCILFAANKVPGAGAGFRLISPRLESSLNNAGVMRIDAHDADIIPTSQLAGTPEILKILFRGTKADLGIVERIRRQGYPTLDTFWREAIGVAERNNLRGSGNGYQTLRPSSRIRKKEDGLPGCDASYLHDLPKIDKDSFTSIFINTSELPKFSEKRLHDPRSREIFKGPLLVVRKSIPAAAGRINVAIVEEDAVFTTTFYGYSPIGYDSAAGLIRYLAMVLGSKLTLWMALVTSGEFGFERETVEKATLDRISIPEFRELTSKQRREIKTKFEGLRTGKLSWEDIDEWVIHIYGLGSRDLQVISDTLEFNLPFAANKQKAQAVPSQHDIKRFCKVLKKELAPWTKRFGSSLAIDSIFVNTASPWYGIGIRTAENERSNGIHISDWEGLLYTADREAASEILIQGEKTELLVGRLAQRRYWSDTQARLLAQRIIWSRLDFLKGHIDA